MDWIIENVEWLFSGIGVIVISLFFKKKSDDKKHQNIVSGDRSTNIQGGDNTTLVMGDRDDG